ncbi:serine/threonine protein kinase [Asanoa hainanensis]|uniref:non-specific serine/threonine protein kinase n=1 Tax=Asanoa hainanensis TaxID=560556 RepID=A0A239NX45_9ACTN|nr:serine/threonine-protein kinase [Asanoa hainanensis]SNT59033.1 serine/threonine protein kinase [Asanoa hainanensis]
MAGRRLADRYELEEVVARGGMGVVWRARDLRLDRAVAVKLVSVSALTDPTVIERFDREARTVARLNHPNIVAVFDFGTDDGDSYLVMEFVEGRSLAAVIGDGPLPVAEATAVAAQACAGLSAAHAAGVVHRDVKPANLVRTHAGVVKICDFGIAHLQHVSGQARLTSTAIAMGSTSYMSPEQVNGDPVDARTDLYGLGCTIHAMLTGAPPFVGVTPLSVVHQHVTQSPPDVRTARPDVPAALARLVDELLAKSPDARPSDADAVLARLAGEPATSAPDVRPSGALPARLFDEPAASPSDGRPGAAGLAPVADDAPAPLAGPPARRRRRRAWGIAGVAAGAVAAIALASLLAATRDGGPDRVAAPPAASAAPASAPVPGHTSALRSPTPSRSTRTTTAPAAPPSPTKPRPTRTSPPAVAVDPVTDLRRTIDAQVDASQLKAKEAADLHKRVDDIADRLDRDAPDAPRKIGELRTRLADLRRQDKLTETGYAAISRAVDRLPPATV